jgi:predicted membrane protein
MSQQINNKNTGFYLGLFLAFAGIMVLLKQFNIVRFDISIWPLFFIAGGVINGIDKGFNRIMPIALIVIGVFSLIPKFYILGVSSKELFWPLVLITIGVSLVINQRKKTSTVYSPNIISDVDPKENIHGFSNELTQAIEAEQEIEVQQNGLLNIEAYFGGRKEFISSKSFNGCKAVAVFGGVEINLMQADSIAQPMVLDLKVFCGGVEIVVPSHWEIVNEVDVFLGGIEDKRVMRTAAERGDYKKLLLRGNVVCGGLEIKSY